MICTKCGQPIAEGSAFCGNCGQPVQAQAAPQQPAYEQPQQPAYQQPVYTQPQPSYGYVAEPNTLPLGIVSLCLSCAPIGSIVGIILGAKGKNQAAQYEAAGNVLSGKTKVGGILSKVGMILSIAMTAFWSVYFFIIMVAAMSYM